MDSIDAHAALFALTRAVHFGACLLLPGVFVFDRFIVGRDHPAHQVATDTWTPIGRRLILLALPAALVSGAAWLVFVAMGMNDVTFAQAMDIEVLRAVLNQTQFGVLWECRAVAWLVAAIAAAFAVTLRRRSILYDASAWLALIAGCVLLASISRTGHGGEGTRWHQAADMVHLLIGSAWPVGLLPLALLLWRFQKTPGLSIWISLFPLVQRFSAMSFAAVLLMTVSGIANSWSLVGKLSNLVNTTYGQTLLVKISLFALMTLLGAINMLYLRPRLSLDFQSSTECIRKSALRRLVANVWLEVVMGVGVLCAAGLLGTLMPACDCCCAS